MWAQSFGGEVPLKEEVATHSSISCLVDPRDRGAWRATVHGVSKSRSWLSNQAKQWFLMTVLSLNANMFALSLSLSLSLYIYIYIYIYTYTHTHTHIYLDFQIYGSGLSGKEFTSMPVMAGAAGLILALGRKWQPTWVFLPGKTHGQRILGDYSPWDCKRVGHDLATEQQQKCHNCII